MTDLLYNAATGFTTVAGPYAQDRFVRGQFRAGGDAMLAPRRFGAFLKDRPLLATLLSGLAETREKIGDGAPPIPVTDCGAFMGRFAIATALVAKDLALPTEIHIHEANPALIAPIRENLALYSVAARLHSHAVAGSYGRKPFAHTQDGLMSGSLHHPALRPGPAAAAAEAIRLECDLVPLRDILPPELAPGLVKLDIKGAEPAALASLAGDGGRMMNVFIVDFVAARAGANMGENLAGASFGDFLFEDFHVFDLGNWLRAQEVHPLRDPTELKGLRDGKGTDLLLIPREMADLAGAVAALAPSAPAD